MADTPDDDKSDPQHLQPKDADKADPQPQHNTADPDVDQPITVAELEHLFKDRFTDKDELYMATLDKGLKAPPCVENWPTRSKRNWDWSRDGKSRGRGRGGWNRGDNRHHHDDRHRHDNRNYNRDYRQHRHNDNHHGNRDNRGYRDRSPHRDGGGHYRQDYRDKRPSASEGSSHRTYNYPQQS